VKTAGVLVLPPAHIGDHRSWHGQQDEAAKFLSAQDTANIRPITKWTASDPSLVDSGFRSLD
jgi:hypothetical protein